MKKAIIALFVFLCLSSMVLAGSKTALELVSDDPAYTTVDEYSFLKTNPDGSQSMIVSSSRLSYVNNAGTYSLIVSDLDGVNCNTAADFELCMPSTGNITLAYKGINISFDPLLSELAKEKAGSQLGTSKNKTKTTKNMVSSKLFKDAEVEFYSTQNGLKEILIVDKDLGAYSYSTILSISGLEVDSVPATSSPISVGEFTIPQPFVEDAGGKIITLEHELISLGHGLYKYSILVPSSVSSALVYPAKIDPSIRIGYQTNSISATWLASGSPDTNYGTSDDFTIGGGGANGLVRLNGSILPPNAYVNNVSVSFMFNSFSAGSSPIVIGAYEMTQQSWTKYGATWNKYNGVNAWASAGGDFGALMTSVSLAGASQFDRITWVLDPVYTNAQLSATGQASYFFRNTTAASQVATFWSDVYYLTDSARAPYFLINFSLRENQNVLFSSVGSPSLSSVWYSKGALDNETITFYASLRGGRNLLLNPGFEINTSGVATDAESWTESANADRVTNVSYSGNASLMILASTEGTGQSVVLDAYTKYRLSAWVRKDSGTTCYLDFTDAPWECSAYWTGSDWGYTECYATTNSSPGTNSVRAVATSATCYFDDVKLEEVPFTPLLFKFNGTSYYPNNLTKNTGNMSLSKTNLPAGSYSYNTTMLDGGYATFDGTGDSFTNSSSACDAIENLTAMTICAWVRIDTSSDGGYLFRRANVTDIFIGSSGTIRTMVYNGSAEMYGTSTGTIEDDVPHFVCGSWDKNQNSGEIWSWIDGVHDGTGSGTTNTGPAVATSCGISDTTFSLEGSIYDLKIWNKQLTPSEIVQAMNYGTPQSGNLKAAWNFNEYYGTVLADSSATGLNMTMSGNPVWHSFTKLNATLSDDFTAQSLNTQKWLLASGTSSISNSTINVSSGLFRSVSAYSYGMFKIRAASTGSAQYLGMYTGSATWVRFVRGNAGDLWCEAKDGGSATTAFINITLPNNYTMTEYAINWSSGKALYYVDGLLACNITTNVPSSNLYLYFGGSGGNTILDYVEYSNTSATFSPSLTVTHAPAFTWTNGTATNSSAMVFNQNIVINRTGINVTGWGNCTVPIATERISFGGAWNSTNSSISSTNTSTTASFLCEQNQSLYSTYWVNPPVAWAANDSCNTSSVYKINFTSYLEELLSNTTQSNWEIAVNLTATNITGRIGGGVNISNSSSALICFGPGLGNLTVNTTTKYGNETGFPTRYYFLINSLIPANKSISVYSIGDNDSSSVQFTVYTSTGQLAPAKYIRVERFFPALNAYILVAMGKTDSNGQATIPLRVDGSVFYRIYAVDSDGETVLREYPHENIFCPLYYDCKHSLVLPVDPEISPFWEDYGDVLVNCNYTNTTYTVSCSWIDTSGDTHEFNLSSQKIGFGEPVTVCSSQANTSSGTLFCTFNETNGTIYSWKFTRNSIVSMLDGGLIDLRNTPFKELGLLLSFMVIGTSALIGVAIPGVGPILAVVGLIASSVMGLIEIDVAVIGGLFIVAILLARKITMR